MNKPLLSNEQIAMVVSWMDTWEQLNGGVIPIRFIESFKDKSKEQIANEIEFSKDFKKKIERPVFIPTSELINKGLA